MITPSVRSACAVLIMRLVVVIIMAHSVPDCAVVVQSAFSETTTALTQGHFIKQIKLAAVFVRFFHKMSFTACY